MEYTEDFLAEMVERRVPDPLLRRNALMDRLAQLFPVRLLIGIAFVLSPFVIEFRAWMLLAIPACAACIVPAVLVSLSPEYREAESLLAALYREYPLFWATLEPLDES